MYVIALTGGIGSGKSEAAKVFTELGVPVTDVDEISHQLTAAQQPIIQDIQTNFGKEYITAEGALNRPAMRDLVFNDHDARDKLNAILHPAIYTEALRQISLNNHAPYQVLAIPLLFESPRYASHVNRILLIDCNEKTRIERVKKRSQLSESEIKKIIRTQTPRKKQLLLAHDVIENNENVEKLREKILLIHEKYLNTCIVS
ncbi:MAG TPA: dephospho-CoA kinase [Methylotenera sp.]|nr:dephospho-CoA kinase [Methylotenera sp.]